MVSKRNLLFQGPIFRFHISFQGSIYLHQQYSIPYNWVFGNYHQNIITYLVVCFNPFEKICLSILFTIFPGDRDRDENKQIFELPPTDVNIPNSTSISCTPLKTNMEPENNPLKKEKHLPNHHFLRSMLVFGGVNDFFTSILPVF